MSSTSNKNIDTNSTIDVNEVEKFTRMADEWWDENGKFKPLHLLNPVRVQHILQTIKQHFNLSAVSQFSNLTLLDVGCGGGLLAEPMARSGMHVTAIDASEKNIAVAKIHAQQSELAINYQAISAEQLLAEKGKEQFDIVLAMEVIEHVADVEAFCEAISALVKPGGYLYVATLNRTVKSYALAIIGAEYIMRWLPIGTHEWHKFLKPAEICQPLENYGMKIEQIQGVSYDVLGRYWYLSQDINVNYMICSKKPL